MKTYTKKELEEILEKHQKWLNNKKGGERADLSESDLSKSDLSRSNLSKSNLRWSNLKWSNLSKSDLRWSDLSGSDLSGSDLSESNLRGSSLRWSNLSGSDLSGSNLSKSDLRWSILSGSDLSESDLRWSKLSKSSLRWSNLSGSDLRWSDLRSAFYGDNILKAYWKDLPDKLVRELMRWDASWHPNGQKAYSDWAKGKGGCPTDKWLRVFFFKEDKKLWRKGKPQMTLTELRVALFNNAGIKYDKE